MKYEIDMSQGPLLRKIISFSLPLMLTGVLQLLYNAADIIVVGKFTGSTALAAVGSTSALVNLMVNLFIGLSVGASVVVAHYQGAREPENVSQTVHTSLLLSVISGLGVGLFGFFMAERMLTFMGTPPDVLPQATLYLRIYFTSMPAAMLYNFGAGILRAIGDTRRPLYYLIVSGLLNVSLNLLLVIRFHMGVAGVAWGTVASQYLSAILITICLVQSHGSIHLDFQNLRIHRDKLAHIVKIGLPAGLQGALFSISNVLIQSSINSFGSTAMAAAAASANLEGFTYTSMNAVSQAALSFVSQNMGARQYRRINRVFWLCAALVCGVGLILGGGANLFGRTLLQAYTSDPLVIDMAMKRLMIVALPYFLYGLAEVQVGCVRGMGHSVTPMIVSLLGICVLRVIWIYTVFAVNRTQLVLYLCYPVSWIVTIIGHGISRRVYLKRILRENAASLE